MYRVVQRGTERYREVQRGTERYRVKQRGAERYREVQSDTERYREAQRGTEMYRVVQRGTERYRKVQRGICREVQQDSWMMTAFQLISHFNPDRGQRWCFDKHRFQTTTWFGCRWLVSKIVM